MMVGKRGQVECVRHGIGIFMLVLMRIPRKQPREI